MKIFEGMDWVYIRIRPIVWGTGFFAAMGLAVILYQYLPLNYADHRLAMDQIALAEKVLFDASGYAAADDVLQLVQEAEIHLAKAREMVAREDYSSARSHAFLARSVGEKALARSGHRGVLDREANFFRLEGKVSVRHSGRLVWQPADYMESLHAGDTIKTASRSIAEIIYTDGRITKLGASSLMEIHSAVATADSQRLDVVEILSGGTLQITPSRTAAPDSTHRITAGKVSAIASIQDTEMNVTFDAQTGTTDIDVNQGAVRVTTSGQEVRLQPGTRIRVNAKGRAGLPQPILPGPRLLAPEEARLFRHVNPEASHTTVAWSSVVGASGYRLEVDVHPGLPEPDIVSPHLTETSARLPPLGQGWWFWRVMALDHQGIPGRPSAVGSFQISQIRPTRRKDDAPPGLIITEVLQVGNIVILTGTTDILATLIVQGRWVIPEEDGEFTAVVHLPHTGKHTITMIARDLSGNETTVLRHVYLPE